MVSVLSNNQEVNAMSQIATVREEILSDNSKVHNVVLWHANGERLAEIGAEDRAKADAIAAAINDGAVWVTE